MADSAIANDVPAAPVLKRLTGRLESLDRRAIPAVRTAHPDVLNITLAHATANGEPVLIEATCNQVNQDGGYTGLTPQALRDQATALARTAGLRPDRLILGGDHLEHFRFSSNHGNALSLCFTQFWTENRFPLFLELL